MTTKLLTFLEELAFHPKPLRVSLAKKLLARLPVSYAKRLEYDAVDRPHYGYCIYHAALQAKALGRKTMSILEFGVAGGNGLVNIEDHARQIGAELGMSFEIYGFDGGTGLPAPLDYRDLPYHWKAGAFPMDVPALKARLKMSQLVLGSVAETVPVFLEKFRPAPIGACFFDLDYYSSTKQALRLFSGDAENFLPRVNCYFDDILGEGTVTFNDSVGELCAIREFNEESPSRKIAKIDCLSSLRKIRTAWNEQVYVYHDFKHPAYDTYIGADAPQLLPLSAAS
jgi:hypothetical protein